VKASSYNHFIEVGDGKTVLAYNSYSGALAEIEKENYPRIRQLLEDPRLCQTDSDREFLQCLADGGFLIPDLVDQAATVKTRSRTVRLGGSLLALTIAPTLACNFACDYCFESRSSIVMSRETQDALLRFADRELVRSEALRVSWFGGEPTLCFNILERIQSGLLKIAEKRRTEIVPGQIITNAYLLNETMAQKLKDLQVTHAQVTIDGPREIHDARRKLRNGKGSFDRIMENLVVAADILKINIRINVDKENVDSACAVAEVLQERGILDKVRVTFAQVLASGGTCADIRDRCFDNAGFARTLVQIQKRLFSKGIYKVNTPRIGSGATCGAVADGNYVISPTGHLFKCWEDLSIDGEKSVGDLFSTELSDRQKQNREAYRTWDPFKMGECRDCGVLPICLGGCPLSTLHNPEASCGDCAPWKFNLKDIIELAYVSQAQTQPDNPDQT
jgi:uncharacterized protein